MGTHVGFIIAARPRSDRVQGRAERLGHVCCCVRRRQGYKVLGETLHRQWFPHVCEDGQQHDVMLDDRGVLQERYQIDGIHSR